MRSLDLCPAGRPGTQSALLSEGRGAGRIPQRLLHLRRRQALGATGYFFAAPSRPEDVGFFENGAMRSAYCALRAAADADNMFDISIRTMQRFAIEPSFLTARKYEGHPTNTGRSTHNLVLVRQATD